MTTSAPPHGHVPWWRRRLASILVSLAGKVIGFRLVASCPSCLRGEIAQVQADAFEAGFRSGAMAARHPMRPVETVGEA